MDQPDGEAGDGRRRRRQARDAELVAAVHAGDPTAFGRLHDVWFDAVFDVAARLVRHRPDAVAVTVETLEAAWRRLPSLDPPEALAGWLLRLARNAALVRHHGARPGIPDPPDAVAGTFDDPDDAELPDGDAIAGATGVAAALADPTTERLLWAAGHTLAARDLSMLDLHLRHDLAPGEAASALGLNPAAAHRQVVQLQERLDTAVRAVVVWAAGEPACDQLTAKLRRSRVETFDIHAVRLVDRHVRTCPICPERHRLAVEPADLLAAVPLATPSPAEQARAGEALMRAGVPLQGSTRVELAPPPAPPVAASSSPATRIGDRWRRNSVVAAATAGVATRRPGPVPLAGAAAEADRSVTVEPAGEPEPEPEPEIDVAVEDEEHEPATTVAAAEEGHEPASAFSFTGVAGRMVAAGVVIAEPTTEVPAVAMEAAGGDVADPTAGTAVEAEVENDADADAEAEAEPGAAAGQGVADDGGTGAGAPVAEEPDAPPAATVPRADWSSLPYAPEDEEDRRAAGPPVLGLPVAADVARSRPVDDPADVVVPMPVGPWGAALGDEGWAPARSTALPPPPAPAGRRDTPEGSDHVAALPRPDEIRLARPRGLPIVLAGAAAAAAILIVTILVVRPDDRELVSDVATGQTTTTVAVRSGAEHERRTRQAVEPTVAGTTASPPDGQPVTTVAPSQPASTAVTGPTTVAPRGGVPNPNPNPSTGVPAPPPNPPPTLAPFPAIARFEFMDDDTLTAPFPITSLPRIRWELMPDPSFTLELHYPPAGSKLNLSQFGAPQRVPCPVKLSPLSGWCDPPPGEYQYDLVLIRLADGERRSASLFLAVNPLFPPPTIAGG